MQCNDFQSTSNSHLHYLNLNLIMSKNRTDIIRRTSNDVVTWSMSAKRRRLTLILLKKNERGYSNKPQTEEMAFPLSYHPLRNPLFSPTKLRKSVVGSSKFIIRNRSRDVTDSRKVSLMSLTLLDFGKLG